MKHDRLMLASTLQSRGGKARAAALSPARRAEIAKKAAAARWAAFGKGSQSGEAPLGIGDLRTPEERAAHVEHVLSAPIAKPCRALPKAGTVNALVLAAMSINPMTVDAIYERAADVYGYERLRNALSSLRSAGHVVSEPKPGSRREKLWRLA
jgi:hypothetical protein